MLTVKNEKRCDIKPDMFGLFFEDINYGLDGGLHAEMIENRSFEFYDCGGQKFNWYKKFDGLYGWNGNASAELKIATDKPVNAVNPHYLKLVAGESGAAFTNKAYDGIFMKAGQEYKISLYVRGNCSAVKIEIRDALEGDVLCTAAEASAEAVANGWTKLALTAESATEIMKGVFCVVVSEPGEYHFDFISMKPTDAVYGVFRRDLADALKALKPGFLRFPGGCVVEGNNLANMYRWKLSVGEPEGRKANWNRWAVHQNDGHGPFAHYNQTLGVGYFEYFMLCEYIGAKPLPVCNVGMACQYESNEMFEIEDDIFGAFVQDAVDLVEFANGDSSTKWGALRAKMGHPAPFGLELMGIGNEQWETPESRFFERYTIFEKAIHEKYPEIKLIGSAGPDVTSNHYTDAWDFYRKAEAERGDESFAYAIDEHYYVKPQWMISNNHFYDNYSRNIKVFAGEYAAHVGDDIKTADRNCLEAAVSEAAFMTGLERNADVVVLASYAPLFARDGYVQWAPDMIWFDDTKVSLTPNYYVQQFYSTKTGNQELIIPELDKLEKQGIFACASRTEDKLFVKVINTTEKELITGVDLSEFNSGKAVITVLTGEKADFNSVQNPNCVVPKVTETDGLPGEIKLPGMSVQIIEIAI